MVRIKVRERARGRARSPPAGHVELRQCPWVVALTRPSAPPPSAPFIEPATQALLEFLFNFGFDSRLGLVCCAPAYVAGRLCLLYSPRLVEALSTALCMKLEKWEDDFSYRTWARADFFPQDLRFRVRDLAQEHLPIYAGDLEAACCLDAAVVCGAWKAMPEHPPHNAAQVKIAKQFLARKRHSRAPGQPKQGGAPLPSLGMPLSKEAVDFCALNAIVEGILGHARASWHEHVGWGWRPAGGASVRSRLCVEHDAFYGYKVADLEVISGRDVPFPRLYIPPACPLLSPLLARDPPEWLLASTDGRNIAEAPPPCSSVPTACSASNRASTIASGDAKVS
jgi:hypothetical protein